MNYELRSRIERLVKGVMTGDYRWGDQSITGELSLNTTCETIVYWDGTTYSTDEILNNALSQKRAGNYDAALKWYMDVIEGTLRISEGIPAGHIRGMTEVLMAANEYFIAFVLLNECEKNVMRRFQLLDSDSKGVMQQIHTTLTIFERLTQDVLNDEFGTLLYVTQQYSGNPYYHFVYSENEIKRQFEVISQQKNYSEDYHVN